SPLFIRSSSSFSSTARFCSRFSSSFTFVNSSKHCMYSPLKVSALGADSWCKLGSAFSSSNAFFFWKKLSAFSNSFSSTSCLILREILFNSSKFLLSASSNSSFFRFTSGRRTPALVVVFSFSGLLFLFK
uniref:Secreted protein n=1 Tax=Ascaris lumbricoides TaxID=6252 RepID=A0A0M3ITG7_ASCLU